jgi:L-fucose isomerase-like protein
MSEKKMTMGVIIGNRGFFPDQLAKSGREEMIQALTKAGIDCVVLGPQDSKHGAVETHEEAKRCAALFQKNRDRLDGVIVRSLTPCAWLGSTFRCWYRPRPTTRPI